MLSDLRGKKVSIEGGESRWVFFKFERLPNFCYRCGLLDHGEKDCPERKDGENYGDEERKQYGAWLRGEPGRSSGRDYGRMGHGLVTISGKPGRKLKHVRETD